MKSLSQLAKDFGTARRAYHILHDQAPRIIGDIAVKETQRNFHMQGFVGGGGYDRWKPRKSSTNEAYNKRGNYKGSVFNSGAPILKQTGNLYDSIKYVVNGKRVDVGINLNQAPYGKVHNEGLGKMPKRQFIGFGKRLIDRTAKEMVARRRQIFKNFLK